MSTPLHGRQGLQEGGLGERAERLALVAERGGQGLGADALVPCGWPGLDGGHPQAPRGPWEPAACREAGPLLALTVCSAAGDPPLCSIPIENILAVEPLEEESFKMKSSESQPLPTPDPLPRVLVCSWTCEAEPTPCLLARTRGVPQSQLRVEAGGIPPS